MSQKLLVPDIGEFEKVEVIELLVNPGDKININDPIVTIESDKSSVEIPSTISGKIEFVNVKVGDKVSIQETRPMSKDKIEAKEIELSEKAKKEESKRAIISQSLKRAEFKIKEISKNFNIKDIKFDNNLSIKQMSLELNRILEKMIQKNPAQWIWSHGRWK